jgi:hypothetical protein
MPVPRKVQEAASASCTIRYIYALIVVSKWLTVPVFPGQKEQAMCSFVTDCLDISKLTEEEKTCLEKYLQDRKTELQAKINDLQARIGKVNDAERALRPGRGP